MRLLALAGTNSFTRTKCAGIVKVLKRLFLIRNQVIKFLPYKSSVYKLTLDTSVNSSELHLWRL